MKAVKGKLPNWYIGALDRGFAIIKTFDDNAPSLKIADIARKTGISRFAVRRFMKTLEALGYVGVEAERYFLKPRILEIGYSYLSASQLSTLVQPYLDDLVRQAGGSASYAVMDENEVMYVARAVTPALYNLAVKLHSRQPAYALSAGRIMLAHFKPEELNRYLSEVPLVRFTNRTITSSRKLKAQLAIERAQGWAGLTDEISYGVTAIAVPLRTPDGRAVAAINLNLHGALQTLDELVDLHLVKLQQTGAAMEREILAKIPHT